MAAGSLWEKLVSRFRFQIKSLRDDAGVMIGALGEKAWREIAAS